MLQGKLVTLRAFQPEDLDALTAFQNDVETELLSGGDPPTPTPRETMAEMWERRRASRDNASFVIEADDKVIGQAGLFGANAVSRTVMLGITIGDKDYWGRGYGSEAVELMVDYAFRMQNVRKVCLSVLGNNPRAIAAYLKAGFVEEGRQVRQEWSDGDYVDLVLMGVFRDGAGDAVAGAER
jgi:RimJ/RimL family protein N-acetyltransferase